MKGKFTTKDVVLYSLLAALALLVLWQIYGFLELVIYIIRGIYYSVI